MTLRTSLMGSAIPAAVAIVLGLSLCDPACASGADGVDVQMWTIRATHDNAEISPELKPLAKILKKTFKFTGYKLIKSETRAVAPDKPATWTLPASLRATIKLMEKTSERIKLDVHVVKREGDKDRNKLRTTFSLKPEKAQLFGGWKLEGDDLLIVAVSAR